MFFLFYKHKIVSLTHILVCANVSGSVSLCHDDEGERTHKIMTNPIDYPSAAMALVNRLLKFALVFGLPVLAILSIFYSSAHRNNKVFNRIENSKWMGSSHRPNNSFLLVKYCPLVSTKLSNKFIQSHVGLPHFGSLFDILFFILVGWGKFNANLYHKEQKEALNKLKLGGSYKTTDCQSRHNGNEPNLFPYSTANLFYFINPHSGYRRPVQRQTSAPSSLFTPHALFPSASRTRLHHFYCRTNS